MGGYCQSEKDSEQQGHETLLVDPLPDGGGYGEETDQQGVGPRVQGELPERRQRDQKKGCQRGNRWHFFPRKPVDAEQT